MCIRDRLYRARGYAGLRGADTRPGHAVRCAHTRRHQVRKRGLHDACGHPRAARIARRAWHPHRGVPDCDGPQPGQPREPDPLRGGRRKRVHYQYCAAKQRLRLDAGGLMAAARAVTVLVHGLWTHGLLMVPQRRYLASAGIEAVCYSYPSVRLTLTENADRLAAFARTLAVPVVHWVGHSLGGLIIPVSYTHLRAHETPEHLVCRLLLEKKKKKKRNE